MTEFDLARFVAAQDPVWPSVLAELRAGRKASHWMWFVFPQLRGLGHSPTAQRYAIGSLAEAQAYRGHAVLGPRLVTAAELVLAVPERPAQAIFGSPDDLKFRSSITLFAQLDPAPSPFAAALHRFFAGQPDPATLRILADWGAAAGA